MPQHDGYYSPSDVAKHLSVSERTVRYWVQKRLIQPSFITRGNQARFSLQRILDIKRQLSERSDHESEAGL